MKKFLLSLAAMALCSGAAMAGSVTFDFANNAYGLPNDDNTYVTIPTTITSGGVSILLNGNTNAWRYWNDGLREYRNNAPTFTVSAGGDMITSVEWTAKTGAKFALSSKGEEITSWSGSAESVTFYGDISTGNAAITSLTVTFDGEGTTDPDPDPDQPDQPGPDQPTVPEGDNVEFNFSAMGFENGTPVEKVNLTPVTIVFDKASGNNAPAYYNSGTNLRLYTGNTMTFTSEEGYVLTGIVFTTSAGYNFNDNVKASKGSFVVDNTTTTWTAPEKCGTVTFTQSGSSQVRMTNIVVYFAEGNAEDGGEPEQPEQPGEVISVAKALELISQGSTATVQVSGIISEITEISTEYGNATYIIKDALTDANGLTVFRGKWLNGESFTSTDQLAVGGKVVVEGALMNYNGTPELGSGNKVISYTAPEPGDVPEPDVPTGMSVTFDFSAPETLGIDYVPEQQENNLTGVTITSGPVNLYFANNGGSTEPRLWYSSGAYTMRFYKDNAFTVSVTEGYDLKGVEFNGTNIGKDWTVSTGFLEGNTWTPSDAAVIVDYVTFGKSETGNNPTVKTMTVYYDSFTGVESIGAEDGEAVYFNLQGVKVNNPERGIFIKVVNGKATKIVK